MTINEEIKINAYATEQISKEQLKSSFRDYMPIYASEIIPDNEPDKKVSGVNYYQKSVQDLGSGYQFTYQNKFALENYSEARSIKGGFKSSNVIFDKNEKSILISTDKGGLLYFNKYPLLTEVRINITSDYVVKECNADMVKDNVYTWIINKDSKKNIYMLIDQSKVRQEIIRGNESNNDVRQEEQNKEVEKKYSSKFEEFINKHPFIVAISALLIFIVFVLIIKKIVH